MVSLKIKVKKRDVTWVVLLAVVLAVGIGYAYGTSDPVVMGHSAGEIEGLEELLTPSGAVMAFNLNSCPSGWSEYTSAKNRVIVGSGGSYSRGATGGAKTHTLTVAQMPKHRHASAMMIPGGAPGVGDGSQGWPLYQRNQGQWTTYVGSNQPHNNMQPYIALLYCQKN